jgi:sulfoxide reductase heme-binding subunit YedZ
MTGPWLWYLDRATGLVLLVLLTLVTVLGVLASRRSSGGWVPAFVPQRLHRNLAVLSLGLLAAHVVTGVVDEYVDLRWWQTFVPFRGAYQPLWIGLGAIAVDALAVVTLSSLARARFGHRAWRILHLTAYAAWPAALAHAVGLGTDMGTRAGAFLVAGCVGVVLTAVLVRVGDLLVRRPRRATATEGLR